MATEIQTIKASQLEELTEVTDLNYVVVTDGVTSKKVKATNLKGIGGSGGIFETDQLTIIFPSSVNNIFPSSVV